MTVSTNADGQNMYSTSFVMYVANEEEEGLYNLYFHNCLNYNYEAPLSVDFTVRDYGAATVDRFIRHFRCQRYSPRRPAR